MVAISFQQPGLLLLLVLIPAIWFWPRRAREPWHALLRSALLALVILALAHPVRLGADEVHHQVVVLDWSKSTGGSQDLSAIHERLDEPGDNDKRYFLVIGGDDAVRDLENDPDPTLVRTIAAGERSPLGNALSQAALLIPDGSKGSVTLFSDGMATDRRWATALEALTARGIPLHTIQLDTPTDDVRPVAFAAGEVLRIGQTARLQVDLVGPAADVRVVIRDEKDVIAESQTLRLDGRRRLTLEFEPKQAGFFEYTAQVVVEKGTDRYTDNNQLTGTFAVQDPIRVLYLGGRVQGGADRLGDLLGKGFQIEEPGAGNAGSQPLESYDLAMIDDRPAKDLPSELQKKLVAAVTDKGLGVCMSGGGASFGPGGYHKTPIESILPVELVQKEEKKDPSTALAIIIDTSGSMGGNRIILAKEVTRLALRRLLPHDKVGIVEFYGTKRWAAPLQSAANAIDIQRALNRLDSGGGTVLFPAIEEAYYGLRNVQTRYKHVLVLTDAGVESGPYETLLRRMSRDGICVSTVLVGPGRHSEFLVELADWGRGRFYNASDRFNLPEIMLKQPSSSRLPGYRAGVQMVEAQGGQGWWGQTDPKAVPAIGGYVETRNRPGAEVLLRTQQDRHPVLASWRFGLGRVTALTTEPTGPGTEGWRSWNDYGAFMARVLSRTASEGRLPFRFELVRNDHRLVLRAERLDRSTAVPTAKIVDNDLELKFQERAPGLFETRFSFKPELAVQVLAGVVGRHGSFRLASSRHEDMAPERQVDPARALQLAAAAKATGGKHLSFDETGFSPSVGGGSRPVGVQQLWPLCLLLALLFYLGDILWRRSPWRTIAD